MVLRDVQALVEGGGLGDLLDCGLWALVLVLVTDMAVVAALLLLLLLSAESC